MTSGSRPPLLLPLPLPLPPLPSSVPPCALENAGEEVENAEDSDDDDDDDDDGSSKRMRGDERRTAPVPTASPRQLPSRIRPWPRP